MKKLIVVLTLSLMTILVFAETVSVKTVSGEEVKKAIADKDISEICNSDTYKQLIIPGAKFYKDLKGISFEKKKGCDLRGVDLGEMKLSREKLEEANSELNEIKDGYDSVDTYLFSMYKATLRGVMDTSDWLNYKYTSNDIEIEFFRELKEEWDYKFIKSRMPYLRRYLFGAYLFGANLSGANLREADLHGANLWRANLQKADLYRANLNDTDLREANLGETNLHEARLIKAKLIKADLSKANLSKAKLIKTVFQFAKLIKADLSGADLSGAGLQWARLYGARLSKVSKANLSGVNWYKARYDSETQFPGFNFLFVIGKGMIKVD